MKNLFILKPAHSLLIEFGRFSITAMTLVSILESVITGLFNSLTLEELSELELFDTFN